MFSSRLDKVEAGEQMEMKAARMEHGNRWKKGYKKKEKTNQLSKGLIFREVPMKQISADPLSEYFLHKGEKINSFLLDLIFEFNHRCFIEKKITDGLPGKKL
jgi:hypothetical protein